MITPTYPQIINNSLSNPTASTAAKAATAAPDTDEAAAVTAVADEALAASVGFVNNFIDTGTGYIFIYIFC